MAIPAFKSTTGNKRFPETEITEVLPKDLIRDVWVEVDSHEIWKDAELGKQVSL